MSQAQEATRRMHRKQSSPLLNVNSSARQFVHASPCLAAYLPVLLLHSDCLYAFVPSQWFVTHLFSIRAVTELPAWPGRVSTGERQVPGEGEGNDRLLPHQQVCISRKKMTAGQSQSLPHPKRSWEEIVLADCAEATSTETWPRVVRSGIRIPAGKDIAILQFVHTVSGADPAFYSMGNGLPS
jgi:hypothetical protein